MENSNSTNIIEYKKSYTYIFAWFYLIEGFCQAIPPLIFPIYIAQTLGAKYDIAQIALIIAIGTIPWSIKLIVGILNDRWGSKRFGRRFPFIVGFGVFGAISWFIVAAYFPKDDSIYGYVAVMYFLSSLGTAFSDTALDGLILDVTPKERLGKIQGFTWTCLLLGMGAGGLLLGLIFTALGIIPILFLLTGILELTACILPYFIEEPSLSEISTEKMGRDLTSIVTKKRNWKVISWTFTAAFTGGVLVTFNTYVILISIGEINVSSTILSITSGSVIQLLVWSSVFYFFNGLGTVIGSLITGKYADVNRKKTALLAYIVYIPFCLVSVVPFLFITGFVPALVIGILIQIIFGVMQAWLLISGMAIRGSVAKKYYPYLISTYYAILIASWNAGQGFGTLLGGTWLFSYLATTSLSFFDMYFILSVVCSCVLAISFFLFRTIDPVDYEMIDVNQRDALNLK